MKNASLQARDTISLHLILYFRTGMLNSCYTRNMLPVQGKAVLFLKDTLHIWKKTLYFARSSGRVHATLRCTYVSILFLNCVYLHV